MEMESGLRVCTDFPHLVSLGSGRLSTAVTLLPLKEGQYHRQHHHHHHHHNGHCQHHNGDVINTVFIYIIMVVFPVVGVVVFVISSA